MLAAVGVKPAPSLVRDMLCALLEAARDDHIHRATGGDGVHGDGWGYVLWARRGGEELLLHRRFYGDKRSEKYWEAAAAEVRRLASLLSSADSYTLIVHFRRASEGTPVGAKHAHPYHVESGDLDIYFAHNGAFHVARTAGEAGVEPRYAARLTDSAVGAKLLARLLERGLPLHDAGRVLAAYTKPGSAMDTATLVLSHSGAPKLMLTAYVHPLASEAKRRYYEYHLIEADGTLVYAASTVVEKAGVDAEPLRDTVLVASITGSGVAKRVARI